MPWMMLSFILHVVFCNSRSHSLFFATSLSHDPVSRTTFWRSIYSRYRYVAGVQFLRDCPVEPHVPVYMLVGGSFGTLKMLWLLWRQVRSRRYERLDLATPVSNLDDGALTPSAGTRVVSAALSLFLVIWFALGNYWVLHIAWPEYKPTLFDPNRWCHKTLYLFAVVHLIVIYSVLALMLVVTLSLLCCQLVGCPIFLRYK